MKKNHEEYHMRHMPQYQAEDTDGKLAIQLRELSATMRSLHARKGSQRRVLTLLSEAGTITQRELTERLGIRSASAGEVIAKLENLGLIVRTPSQEDRRTADISLTEEGRRQAEAAEEQRRQRRSEMFAALTEEEKNQLLVLLEKISADWKERDCSAPEEGERRGCHNHHRSREDHGGRRREMRAEGNRQELREDGHRHGGEPEERSHGEHRGCDHDCEHCTHPCGRSRKQ